MYENIKFNDLFKNKQVAVRMYLSLERKYLNMMEYHRKICRGLDIKPYNQRINRREARLLTLDVIKKEK